jgi:hypothetical protein
MKVFIQSFPTRELGRMANKVAELYHWGGGTGLKASECLSVFRKLAARTTLTFDI